MKNGFLNAKEHGKTKNVSHMAVLKWIESGKLAPIGDAVAKSGSRWMIDAQKADAYYYDNVKLTNQRIPFENRPANTEGAPISDVETPPQRENEHSPKSKNDRVANLNTYHGATTWKAKYEALLRQQEYEIKSGIYILAEEVKTAAFNKARIIRDTLLNIPDRIASILASESDQDKVYQLLSDEIKLALDELAK